MAKLSNEERRLIGVFLGEYKKLLASESVPFNPRSLTIISQPDKDKMDRFDYISYNKWFDEINIESHIGACDNVIQAYLEVPISILISAEEIGKPLLSKKDQKKITKALRILEGIKIERQK